VWLPVRQRFKGGNLAGGNGWINFTYMEFAFFTGLDIPRSQTQFGNEKKGLLNFSTFPLTFKKLFIIIYLI